jgi:hypothetical protein
MTENDENETPAADDESAASRQPGEEEPEPSAAALGETGESQRAASGDRPSAPAGDDVEGGRGAGIDATPDAGPGGGREPEAGRRRGTPPADDDAGRARRAIQPAASEAEPGGRTGWRRYGPIAVVLVLVATVVTGAVVLQGDDEDGRQAATEGGPPPMTGDLPDGVVTWSMAQQQDLDVEFPETCDTETGMVAIPFFFRTECVADVADNGGATAPGVTADEVKIVLWVPNADDPAYGFVRQALGFDDSTEDIRETQEGLIEIFQAHYQTYGREVTFEFVEASGTMLDSTSAQADAIRAAEEEPFAALGGPFGFGTAWTEELQNRDITCVVCPGGTPDEPPYGFGLQPSNSQVRAHVVNYVSRKLAGRPAEHAGEDLQGQERVFGHLKLGVSEGDERDVTRLRDRLADAGVDVAESVTYPFDVAGIQEHATSAVTRMKEAGVTTVLVDTDPLTLPAITEEATKQRWYPEWVLIAPLLADTNAFGRQMDPEQWEHAFGFSFLPPATDPEANPAYRLYEWYHGEPPPAPESLLLTYPQIALFFIGLEFAGPNLTAETFRDGLFAYPPTPQARTQPSVDYGTAIWDRDDYAGIDDMVELWWDPTAEGVDEMGQQAEGMYRYVDGGRRYYADDWPQELRVFEREGSVTQITDPPDEEVPPDYPSPSG